VAPKIKCPVLLFTGDPLMGAIVTRDTAYELNRMCRKLQIVNVQGAGHNIRRDQFEIYYDVMKRFLRQQIRW
jgi:N-formylmaleamate deformylase